MTLKELFHLKGYDYYPTDKDTHHNYLTTYSELFGKWKYEPIIILEVGTLKGGSMKLFEDYFPNALIVGFDLIKPTVELKRARVYIGDFYNDITSATTLQAVFPAMGRIHIAIDDGPHDFASQVKFVQMVYPIMADGGILVVEDVRPNFREHFDKLNIPYTLVETIPCTDEDDDRLLIFRK